MMWNKSWQLMKRECQQLALGELIAMGWLIGFGFLNLLVTLLVGNPSWTHLTPWALDSELTFVTTVSALIYGLIAPYALFKRAIQNGIPRQTSWLAKEGTLLGAVMVAWVLMVLNVVLDPGTSMIKLSPGMHVSAVVAPLVTLLVGAFTLAAIGAGFALLTRRWKVIVGIGLPLLAVVIIGRIAALVVNHWHPSAATLETLAKVFQNPATGWIALVVYLALMLVIDYWFSMKIQLRRD